MKIVFCLAMSLISHLVFASVPADENERLLGALIARGVICEGLNREQQQKALTIYLQRKQRHSSMNKPSNRKHLVYPDSDAPNINTANDLHAVMPNSEPENSNKENACILPPE
ncbi:MULTISPECIES: hypothetical protein [unclassified Moritella]|uniref:hypothetical protein n=1 Tax=unclassified Moritella TaxID=2637987 RepID=UPI001BAB4E84|nr:MULTISPECIES: hypothetical protein [unclassified Moritella]QUM83661.1 hypothetical protein HWV02_03560 [Moritella sp. 28]QUM87955.1 hypothetical protein HWV03_03540 [Moritella sp. 36]